METEEVIKLVDGIYKNILDKFNPGARQLISAGKSYLKALHGAAAASRLFNETLAKIAFNAQQGGTTDIGSALMSIVGVYKEIQDQHMNILKAFYVDLLVPLETNLEKDTKVVQFEQKKFLQQHKVRCDSYSKASATMKKQRKKKTNSQSAEKEIKNIQAMEDEKRKLDAFCEQSLRNAMTQERRRYGFVLERQCSLAKHWMAYHSAGKKEIENAIDNWNEVASSREFLPANVESMFKQKIRDNLSEDDSISDRCSISSQLRKTRSIDASCLDMRSIGDVVNNSMNRAKSEYNLTSNTNLISDLSTEVNHWDQRPIARALYAYLSSGENQLSFLEGDRIALVGERAKGWQFGENLRTQMFGWFPLAYTENEQEENNISNWESKPSIILAHQTENTPDSSLESTLVDEPSINQKLNNSYHEDASPTRMFGDTIMYRQSKQFQRVAGGKSGNPKPGPPPTLPAPVPQPVVPPYSKNHQLSSHSFSSSGGPPTIDKRRSGPATINISKTNGSKTKPGRDVITNTSLHSSNDSGFANEPPPQPEVDYSDEEAVGRVPIRSSRHDKSMHMQRQSHRRSNEDTSDLLTLRKTKSNYENTHIRQSSSYGNLTDENNLNFIYHTTDRRSEKILNDDNQINNHVVKRTKSFWKFGKHDDDILEGMAMWKHRDLVQTENEKNVEKKKEATLKRSNRNSNSHHKSENLTNIKNQNPILTHSSSTSSSETIKNNRSSNIDEELVKYPITKSDIDHRISKVNEENIYGIHSPQKTVSRIQSYNEHDNKNEMAITDSKDRRSMINGNEKYQTENTNVQNENVKYRNDSEKYRNDNQKSRNGNSEKYQNDYYDTEDNVRDDMSLLNNNSIRISNTNFYDDDSVQDMMMMKTVKRKEILKQYYSSGTDTEHNSSSSDPYDCIVVDDHLVRKNENIKKTNNNNINNSNIQHQNNINNNNVNNYKNHDKMEFTTFRGVEAKDETPRTGTLLPRTKLSKVPSVGPIMQTVMQMDKEHDVDIKKSDTQKRNGKIKNSNANNNLSNNKSYGPWYDLWGDDSNVKNK